MFIEDDNGNLVTINYIVMIYRDIMNTENSTKNHCILADLTNGKTVILSSGLTSDEADEVFENIRTEISEKING